MPIKTPVCDFEKKAENFELKSTENKLISLNDIKGENGTLVMFICCLLYTSPSPRDLSSSRMPSSA